MDRIILHCDLNSFYASVEMLYHPETRHLPIAVGGSVEQRHGIILTKNALAKKFGVKTAEPIWQAKSKCPNLIVYPPDFSKYLKFSKLVKNIFLDYSDRVESFGIDEAWIDITHSYHLFGTPYRVAYLIKERIKNELGITASVGISYNKVFAKLASDIQKYDAITIINRENKEKIVDPLPTNDLLFVGNSTFEKLQALNIHTIGDIAKSEISYLKNVLGKTGELIHYYANGHDLSEVAKYDHSRVAKSIGNSTTTVTDMSTYQDIYLVLSILSQSVAARLKQQGLAGKCISVGLRTKELKSFSLQTTLINPTNLYQEILNESMELVKKNYFLDIPLRSIGVSVNKLISEDSHQQLDLFSKLDKEKIRAVEDTVDKIRERFGYNSINYALTKLNPELTEFNPKDDHVIFPIGWKA